MTTVRNPSPLAATATAATLSTPIGNVDVSSFNNWNNTSFSQLCLHKSDAELSMLANIPDLGADKRGIAQRVLGQRAGVTTGNQV
ncbi:MAG: hypothetical protein GZ090_11400 [Oxalobacteraceae bacterium]|nr:hypothetical protein [Oxalobacteraceae bacterium]